MKMDCEVIRDLLPLYADEICSDGSRRIVDEHLQECDECRELLDRLRETEVETHLTQEKDLVIRDAARRFRRRRRGVRRMRTP